jgi:hypothetical protein
VLRQELTRLDAAHADVRIYREVQQMIREAEAELIEASFRVSWFRVKGFISYRFFASSIKSMSAN